MPILFSTLGGVWSLVRIQSHQLLKIKRLGNVSNLFFIAAITLLLHFSEHGKKSV